MNLFGRLKQKLHVIEIVRAIRRRTGVHTLKESHLTQLASSIMALSKDETRQGSWYELSLLILGAPAKQLGYGEIEAKLPSSPIAHILHKWEILPVMHEILIAEETSFGVLSTDANDMLAERLRQVLPEELRGWLDDFKTLRDVSSPNVALT